MYVNSEALNCLGCSERTIVLSYLLVAMFGTNYLQWSPFFEFLITAQLIILYQNLHGFIICKIIALAGTSRFQSCHKNLLGSPSVPLNSGAESDPVGCGRMLRNSATLSKVNL